MDYMLLIQTLVAIGTLGMALVILWLQIIKPWLNEPEIEIEFEQEEPCCKDVPWIFQDDIDKVEFPTKIFSPSGSTSGEPNICADINGKVTYETPAYWIRVKVTNNGKSVAENCEGQLIELRNNEKQLMKKFVPLILRWSSRPDIVPIDINRGASWFLDIIFINEEIKNMQSTEEFSKYAHICDIYRGQHTGTIRELEAGEYYLKIAIYGDNFNPKTREFHMKWGGKWNKTGKESINFKDCD